MKKSTFDAKLLSNIKNNLPKLEKLLEECSGIVYEDLIYRYYHGSFKVYSVQHYTKKIYSALEELSPIKDLITNKKVKNKKQNYEIGLELEPTLNSLFINKFSLY